MSRRIRLWPSRAASASRWRSIRDPSPAPRQSGSTHIRLISPMPDPISCTPPHATGRPSLVATTNTPAPGPIGRGVGVRRVAGVEAGREAAVELGEVVADRLDRHRVGRVDGAQVDGGRPDEQVGRRERLGQPVALAFGQRVDERAGEVLRAVVQLAPRRTPSGGERDQPAAPVVRVRPHVDQPVVGEPAQQPGEVAGVEVEPLAQVADGRAPPGRSRRGAGRRPAGSRCRGTTRPARRSAGCRCG